MLDIDTAAPLHPNNPHYAVLHAQSTELDLINRGFDGIHIRKGEKYNLSFFSRIQGKGQEILQVQLRNHSGKPLAQAAVKVAPGEWTKQHLTLQAVEDADSASLSIQTVTPGIYALDMISLFPAENIQEPSERFACRLGTNDSRPASALYAFSGRLSGAWRWCT